MTKENFLCKDIQKTKTTFFKHAKYAIFFKSRGFRDIKNSTKNFLQILFHKNKFSTKKIPCLLIAFGQFNYEFKFVHYNAGLDNGVS